MTKERRLHHRIPAPDGQQRFLDFHSAQWYRALVCWGWRAAWAEITGYLSLPSTEVLYQ